MKYLIGCLFLIVVMVGACSSAGQTSNDTIKMDRFGQGALLTDAQLRENIERANNGDGHAAYRVWAHYAIGAAEGEKGREKAQKYFDLALKLEYPPALYNKAIQLWDSGKADPELVMKYLKRAIELGQPDRAKLLPQVEAKIKAKAQTEPPSLNQ